MSSELLFEADRYAGEFHRDGYSIREGVVSDVEVEDLLAAVAGFRMARRFAASVACTACETSWRYVLPPGTGAAGEHSSICNSRTW